MSSFYTLLWWLVSTRVKYSYSLRAKGIFLGNLLLLKKSLLIAIIILFFFENLGDLNKKLEKLTNKGLGKLFVLCRMIRLRRYLFAKDTGEYTLVYVGL